MRRIGIIVSAAASIIVPEAPIADEVKLNFCTYVEVFVIAVTRNKDLAMPFSRIDEFYYFDTEKSRFLEYVAHDIYVTPKIDNPAPLVARYVEECNDAISD